jgi:NADH-quinone oxidoreductase subunit C
MLIEIDADASAEIDSGMQSWRDAFSAAHGAGFVFLDLLTVVDRTNLDTDALGPWEFLAHLLRPSDRARRWIRRVRDEPEIESVADLFAAAAWHEREAREMFGVEFTGAAQSHLRPLLLVGGDIGGKDSVSVSDFPMRKRTPLVARLTVPWPGVHEPGGETTSRRSRRAPRPPGVPQAWLTESQERGGSDA